MERSPASASSAASSVAETARAVLAIDESHEDAHAFLKMPEPNAARAAPAPEPQHAAKQPLPDSLVSGRHAVRAPRRPGREDMGDGYMVAFKSAADGLRCAIAIQEAIAGMKDGVRVRIGLHTGR